MRRPGDAVAYGTRLPGLAAELIGSGVAVIVTGVARLVRAFASVEHRGLSLLAAVIDLVLGILILSWPDESLVTLAVFFGISLIFRGVFALVAAFQLRPDVGLFDIRMPLMDGIALALKRLLVDPEFLFRRGAGPLFDIGPGGQGR